MEIVINNERVEVYSPGSLPLYPCESIKIRNKGELLDMFCTFDIETTSMRDNDGNGFGFMYVWGFSVHSGEIAIGRTWEEFMELLKRIKTFYKLSEERKLVCVVHNLPFEFQFIRGFYSKWEVFARSPRDVIKAFCPDTGIEFRCSYALTNMSLKKFLEKTPGVTLLKMSGEEYDYRKIRTAKTPLSTEELSYLCCDVLGLRQGIEVKLIDDTLKTIPMTSTGYVRRNERNACFSKNPYEYKRRYLWPTKPGPYLYEEQRAAARGGNTHTNPCLAGEVIKDVGSDDIASAYPGEIATYGGFPIGGYFKVKDEEQLNRLKDRGKHTYLVRVILRGVHAKTLNTFLYISASRTLKCQGEVIDNGRIISADYIELCIIEELELPIIKAQYDIDEPLYFVDIWAARKGYLPEPIRKETLEYFYLKSKLKGKDKYMYDKSKNLLNSTFGMMLTNILNPETVYDPNYINPKTGERQIYHDEELDIEEALTKYYNKYSSFLVYAWGLIITARCRAKLQEMTDALIAEGVDVIYCDTDSVKYKRSPESDKVLKRLNEKYQALAESAPLPAYVDVEGKRYTLGIWADEGTYDYFCALGAKKYAYVVQGEHGPEFHTVISGVNTTTGPKYFLDRCGGDPKKAIELFASSKDQDIVIPPEYSGRTSSVWNDDDTPHYIEVEGCRMLTAASVGIFDATYTLGITDEYCDLIENPEAYAPTK